MFFALYKYAFIIIIIILDHNVMLMLLAKCEFDEWFNTLSNKKGFHLKSNDLMLSCHQMNINAKVH